MTASGGASALAQTPQTDGAGQRVIRDESWLKARSIPTRWWPTLKLTAIRSRFCSLNPAQDSRSA